MCIRDSMKNGQLKPGYNVNVATVSEYIIGNYISADRTDTKTFIPFLEKLCRKHPVKRVVVDSGYESEENYHYVDGSEQLSLFVKPSNHEQKKKRKYKNDIGRRENMAYDAEKDEYTCAQGQKLQAVAVKKRKSETGYVQDVTVYECAGCKDCPVKEKCIRQKKTDKTPLEERAKRLNVSKYFLAQREAMEQKISTEEGILLRVNRSIQSEGVFAMIKEDMNFRRFLTRGNSNVAVEWYLAVSYTHLDVYKRQTQSCSTAALRPACSPSASTRALMWQRSSGAASLPSTLDRQRQGEASGFPRARRCGSSCCRRRSKIFCPRCSTSSSRCLKRPVWRDISPRGI